MLFKKWFSWTNVVSGIFGLAVLLLAAPNAFAATCVWDGGGVADTNASNVANWVGDAYTCVAGDTLIFAGSSGTGAVTFDAAFETGGASLFVDTAYAGGGITISSSSISFASSTIAKSGLGFIVGSNTLHFSGPVSMTNGTLSAGSGTLDFNDNLFVYSGATLLAGTMTAAKNVTVAGTITPTASTAITFDGSIGQTFTVASSTVQGLTIANTGNPASVAVTLNSTSGGLEIDGALTITQGKLDIGTNNKPVYLLGNLSIDNTNGYLDNSGAARVFHFYGSGTQTLDPTGNTVTLGGCDFTGTATYLLTSNITCDGFLLKSGTFNPRTNAAAVNVGGVFSISNGATYSSSTAALTFNGASLAQVITDSTDAATSAKQDLGTVSLTNTNGVSTATSTRMFALTVGSGVTFNVSDDELLIGGTGTALTITGTLTDNTASTINFRSGGAANINARTYAGALKLTGTGTYTLVNNATVTGNFTMSGAGTFDLNAKTLTVAGTYLNSGGTVTETGASKIVNANTVLKITNSAGTETNTWTADGNAIYLRVADADANKSATSIDSFTVTITGTSLISDTETIRLYETGNATGIFTALVPFQRYTRAIPVNGMLEFSGDGTLLLTFTDAADTTDTGTDAATFTGPVAIASTDPNTTILPAAVSLQINSGAASTNSPTVTLGISATNATKMIVSNSSTFIGSDWEAYTTTKTWQLTPGDGDKTVFVRFQSSTGNETGLLSSQIKLAGSGSVAPVTPAPSPAPAPAPANPPVVTPAPSAPAPSANPNAQPDGSLIRSKTNSAVYYVKDGKRFVFPMANVYNTWFNDFKSVKIVSDAELAAHQIGGVVKAKSGAVMVKLQTDPKVYYVGPNGQLHWITSEAVAKGIYGTAWAKKVIDISDSMFPSYTVGDPIDNAEAAKAIPTSTSPVE